MGYTIGEYSIIGRNGAAVDPMDYETDVAIGALEFMDDETVIGQLPRLAQRFPRLQQRLAQGAGGPRMLNLVRQAAARPLGLGAAAAAAHSPTVQPTAPGPVGLSCIPFNLATLAGGATSQPIAVTPQSIFKPYKLVVDPVIAPFFLINAFANGTVPFIDAPGQLPASIFTADALPNLKKITSNPGIQIQLTIQNRDVVAHPFFATLYGEAAPTQCG